MSLNSEQIKAIAARSAELVLQRRNPNTLSPKEKKLWNEGQEIIRQLDNGVNYRGPWLPDGPTGELLGHFFQDDAVTKTSFVCQDIDDCKAKLIEVREKFKAEPPVFKREEPPFKLTTDVPFYDAFIKDASYAKSKGYKVKIVEMSPDDYISRVAEMQGTDIARQLQMVQQDLVDKYAGMMESGVKFDLPYLDLKRQEQEGRARSLAAKKLGYTVMPVLIASAAEDPAAFTIQENVKPCPNLLPMAEWIKGETPGTCRPCTLTPVVQWYWSELKERGFEDIAAELESEVEVLEEDNVEQVMAICKDLDKIKKAAPADLRKRLEEFDCAIQSFDPAEVSGEEPTAG